MKLIDASAIIYIYVHRKYDRKWVTFILSRNKERVLYCKSKLKYFEFEFEFCIVSIEPLVTYHVHTQSWYWVIIYTRFTHLLTHPYNLHTVTNWDFSIVITSSRTLQKKGHRLPCCVYQSVYSICGREDSLNLAKMCLHLTICNWCRCFEFSKQVKCWTKSNTLSPMCYIRVS